MIEGGVATNKGDFRWTIMVERCFAAGEGWEEFGGKAALVGGFGSSFGLGCAEPFSEAFTEAGAIPATQGVSGCSRQRLVCFRCTEAQRIYIHIPNAAMQQQESKEDAVW